SVPENSTSRLSAKWRKNVRSVSSARSAMSATVVLSYPRSTNSSSAACCRRPTASGFHRATGPILVMTATDISGTVMSVTDIDLRGRALEVSAMRVFVTGASGFIGSAVVRELLGSGHHVVGLARSDESAATIENLGAEVHRGNLTDLDAVRNAASASDGVLHLGFVPAFN